VCNTGAPPSLSGRTPRRVPGRQRLQPAPSEKDFAYTQRVFRAIGECSPLNGRVSRLLGRL